MLYQGEDEEYAALERAKNVVLAPVFLPVKKSPIILPKTEDVRELAKAATVYAVQCLVDIVSDDSAPTASRIAAANALLDRAHGKTTDLTINNAITVEIVDFRKGDNGDVVTITQ